MALPPEGVLRAAARWIELLQRSSVDQALAILKADSHYNDLSLTQYATALDLLLELGLVQRLDGTVVLAQTWEGSPNHLVLDVFFSRAIQAGQPAWLPDADMLVTDATTLPADAAMLAAIAGMSDQAAVSSIHELWSRIDTDELASIGEDGELALAQALDGRWPNSVNHVSLRSDVFGYDIAFKPGGTEWHLEVKTTPRRGRLAVHLSRHEFDVASWDTTWRMVVIGLTPDRRIGALGVVSTEALMGRAPKDQFSSARWQSTRFDLHPADLSAGLPLPDPHLIGQAADQLLGEGCSAPPSEFMWLPVLHDRT